MSVIGELLPTRSSAHLDGLSDDTLALLASRGSVRAFELLMGRYQSRVRRYCERIVGDHHHAEDATVEAFIRAHRGLPRRDRTTGFRAWLFAIARNAAVDARPRRPIALSLHEAEATISPVGIETQVATRAHLRLLIDDIDALPPRQRDALVMRVVHEERYGDIAAMLGITSKAARQAVRDARGHLQAMETGRATACVDIRAVLSQPDRRRRRSMPLVAHLRACEPCRDYAESTPSPRHSWAGSAAVLRAQPMHQ